MGERRRRIGQDQTAAFLGAVGDLPIEVDFLTNETAILALARQRGLTVYDAAYLELAQRRSLPLAAVDDALIRAATAVGTQVWQIPSRPLDLR